MWSSTDIPMISPASVVGPRVNTDSQECQKGRCSCSTQEYTKLESLQIQQSSGMINLQLKGKQGNTLNQDEIQKCLEHIEGRIGLEKQ